jgi:hypothetical protein
MALESGNGRSNGKCPLTSNDNHLHSRWCSPQLISFCDVSKKNYRCSRLAHVGLAAILDMTRRYSIDATQRYSTLLDATRRYSTLLDATRRSSTLLDALTRLDMSRQDST